MLAALRELGAAAALSLVPIAAAQAATRLVPEEFALIQAALDASVPGDTVSVAPGDYPTSVAMREGVTLRGRGGTPAAVIRRFTCQDLSEATRVENLTIRGGSSDAGGGASIVNASPRIVGCVFEDNEAHVGYNQQQRFYYPGRGGAIHIQGTGSRPWVEASRFAHNTAQGQGGAVYSFQASPTFVDCTFEHNGALEQIGHWFDGDGGALYLWQGAPTVRGCVITDNLVTGGAGGYPYGGGGVTIYSATATVEDCVVAWNTATSRYYEGGRGGGILASGNVLIQRCTVAYNLGSGPGGGLYLEGSVRLESSIVAFASQGAGIAGTPSAVSCCDVFGNAGGDAIPGTDGGGNFALDPGFCSAPERDLGLNAASPCLPGHHPDGAECGRLGALPQKCPGVPSGTTSWGRLRAKYRTPPGAPNP